MPRTAAPKKKTKSLRVREAEQLYFTRNPTNDPSLPARLVRIRPFYETSFGAAYLGDSIGLFVRDP